MASPKFSVRTAAHGEHADQQIIQWRVLGVLQVAPALQLSTAAAENRGRQFVVRVAVGVTEAAAIQNRLWSAGCHRHPEWPSAFRK